MAATLRKLYKDIDLVDLWVGGIAEDAEAGSELGETFRTIIVDQFVRIRDGDRFFFENILSKQVRSHMNNQKYRNFINYLLLLHLKVPDSER